MWNVRENYNEFIIFECENDTTICVIPKTIDSELNKRRVALFLSAPQLVDSLSDVIADMRRYLPDLEEGVKNRCHLASKVITTIGRGQHVP